MATLYAAKQPVYVIRQLAAERHKAICYPKFRLAQLKRRYFTQRLTTAKLLPLNSFFVDKSYRCYRFFSHDKQT